MLVEKMVDGIIFAPSSNTLNQEGIYNKLKLPMVLVDKNLDVKSSKGLVKVDNKNGTYEATKYLINQTGNKPMIITVMQEI